MSDLILFWHRRDLRTTDNIGLAAARERSPRVVGVFCLDPNILQRDDVAPARVTYMVGTLRELQENYARAGSQLLILHDQPVNALPRLASALGAKAVFRNQDIEPYGRSRDRAVAAVLQQVGVEVHDFWDQILHAPEAILTGGGQPYTVYSPYWRNWSSKPKAKPMPALAGAIGLTDAEQETAQSVGAVPLPSARELGFVWDNPLLLEPGETAARERLAFFCDSAIVDYQEQRNFPANTEGTSHLSAALKFGAIGVRTVWAKTVEVTEQARSDEAQNSIRNWRQELAWREFYQHALYWFPELAEGVYRKLLKDFPWENNPDYFQAWCDGKTGYPIVDAAMRQMNELGWMHNRCRMITASFLCKDLLVSYQLGEKYFMQRLYDGDQSANNGGWQWCTSSGMDPQPLRIFNPASQTQKFDMDAEYIRQWMPELRSLDTEAIVTGKIPQDERDRCGYPAPIVDHRVQQNKFKQLYNQQRERTGDRSPIN
jgi:deoxyribodipyrimidine photo-lyase